MSALRALVVLLTAMPVPGALAQTSAADGVVTASIGAPGMTQWTAPIGSTFNATATLTLSQPISDVGLLIPRPFLNAAILQLSPSAGGVCREEAARTRCLWSGAHPAGAQVSITLTLRAWFIDANAFTADVSGFAQTSQVPSDMTLGRPVNISVLYVPDSAVRSMSGRMCSVVGTDGDDTMLVYPVPRNAVICGLGGNDTIRSPQGTVEVDGGPGNDTLTGRSSGDIIYGGGGDDRIDGRYGRDRLFGGPGTDVILGGADDDAVFGGDGNDTLNGGQGHDLLSGGGGRDRLLGGELADRLFGGTEPDFLDGGPGRDVIVGGPGIDAARLSGDALSGVERIITTGPLA